MRSSNTALVRLRRQALNAAGGPLTQDDVVRFMRKRGLRRDQVTISDFERAKYLGPNEFVALYAEAIGQTVKAVKGAWDRTRRARKRAAKVQSPASR